MMPILRHGDIEWVSKYLIASSKPHLKFFKHPKEIENLLSKYERVFGNLPQEDQQTEGWSVSLSYI